MQLLAVWNRQRTVVGDIAVEMIVAVTHMTGIVGATVGIGGTSESHL